ncbi:polysaccharide biosynthesis tyrosine autokinase [Plantactinospora sp. GCM10030261]|uniref:polysaccharide biosynthesis tyrosine autokinase n=1 Tax=Plantactinospora sp. GCM10030261 TaxID=3273420 RepID=UPI003608AF2B
MVRRRWWVVLVSVVLALGVAGLVTVSAKPRYAATVTFFVTAPSENGVVGAYQGSLFLQQRTKSYADLLTSDRLAQSVAADGGLGLTADQVQSRISARPRTDTVLLDATVTDTDQPRALRTTEAVAAQFVKIVQAIETRPGEQAALVKVEVVNGPRVSAGPVYPQPLRNLGLAALLGLVVGVGLALLRGVTDTAVRDGETLGRVTGAPLLAQIPYERKARTGPLIVDEGANTPRAEAVRRLRTNLRFVDLQEPARVIAVTSAVQGEGKSTTSCNLAIALAEAGWRVMLIDCDLRRPQIAEYLGLEGGIGLTDVLLGEVELTDVVQAWRDSSLLVLPAGGTPPNPSELLGSKAMADLLLMARDLADIVVIDTAPLLAITDGVVMAVQSDGALLVARAGRTTSAQVTDAVEALERVDARVLGCALNMAKLARVEAAQYYTYRVPEPAGPGDRQPAGGRPPAAEVAVADGVPQAGEPALPVSDATQELSRIPR